MSSNGTHSETSGSAADRPALQASPPKPHAWRTSLYPLLSTAVCLLPALSRWFLPQLPAGADTALHLYRAVELDWLIRNGVLFSRWLPDLVYGYGYPLFNFYGPLAYYLIDLVHFAGLPFIPSTLAVFALADLLAASGAYRLARDIFGRLPGLLAALAYAYSPYLLADLYRGTLAESLCLGLLPWLLWAFYRLWRRPDPRRLALASLLLALFPMLNNPGTALAVPALLAFLGGLYVSRPAGPAAARLKAAGLALLGGAALSAWVWLPLAAEIQFVQIERAYVPAVTNFRSNFLSPAQLLAPPQPADLKLIGGSVFYGLGWPQLALAGLALFGFRRLGRERQTLLAVSAAAFLCLVFLTLPASAWLWETIPGLRLIQLPGRLLGPASLALALWCGSAFAGDPPDGPGRTRRSVIGAAAAAGATLLFGFGWLYVAPDPSIPAAPALADLHAWEHRTGVVGTTTATEYLPRWVSQRPPDDSLAAQYARSAIVDRLDPASLPAGARRLSQTPGVLSQQVEIDSPVDFTARFNQFYFPGWSAAVDGQSVPVSPAGEAGLVSVPVPAGRHTLRLTFADTWPRTAGQLLSLAALLAIILLVLHTSPSPVIVFLTPRELGRGESQPGESRSGAHLLGLAGVGLAVLAFKIAYADRPGSWFLPNRFDGRSVADVQHRLDRQFGDQLQLLGYDETPAGAVLYWRALQPLETDWSVSVALDWQGHRVAQADAQHPAGLPTSRWQVDQYARDVHPLSLLPGTPPGGYDLLVTVYRQSDGLVLGPAAVKIGEVQVTRPARSARLPENLSAMSIGPLELIGITPLEAQAMPGDVVPLLFHWRANATPAQDLQVELWFTGESGPPIYKQLVPPSRPDFGTSLWQAGDEWLGFVDVAVPVDVPSGDYFVGAKGPAGILMVERIRVTAPDRVFGLPKIPHPLDVQFGEVARLRGWESGDDRQFTLYWQALQVTGVRYTVFVHALDAGGDILAQRDAIPGGGTRPTTSWLPPEIIKDTYDLALPAGTAAIRVGLYDPLTGQRLTTPGGGDSVLLQP